MQQVSSYLGYTGRAADVVARAALDPSSRPRLGIVAAQIVYQVHIADREFRFELDQTQAFLLDLGQGARRAVTHDILETALYVALVRATAWRYLLIPGNPEKAKRRASWFWQADRLRQLINLVKAHTWKNRVKWFSFVKGLDWSRN